MATVQEHIDSDKTSKSDAVWTNVDPATLSQDVRQAYEAYKVAQRQAAALREAFETAITSDIDVPAGMRVVFGYRFGQLSMALVEDDRKPSKARPKGTLADFIAAQRAAGRAI